MPKYLTRVWRMMYSNETIPLMTQNMMETHLLKTSNQSHKLNQINSYIKVVTEKYTYV